METKRLLREIKLLKDLKHENIVSIKDILNPLPLKYFNEIYIVTELMDSDLNQIIEDDQELTEDHFQLIMYQILCGIKVK
jgi:mitogen-activated protein kinase 1/3